MPQQTVYLNGQYLPAAEAQVSVMDRGFLLGDGVYEVIPVYGGQPFRLAQHLQRLRNSLTEIRLDLDISDQLFNSTNQVQTVTYHFKARIRDDRAGLNFGHCDQELGLSYAELARRSVVEDQVT